MKRFIVMAMLVGVIAALGITSVVLAQNPNPPVNPNPGNGPMMGRGGMMGGQGTGFMHEYMEGALAAKLSLSVEELEERHAKGETFWQIAQEKGFTVEEAQQMMLDARSTALDKMVSDGVITQEQADWMKQRGSRMMGGQGYGNGNEAGRGFGRGGRMGGQGGCPMFPSGSQGSTN